MARPKLSHPDQPFWKRSLLRLYEFLASLKLAVLLILGIAAVLAIATFIESKFGAAGVQWYVYYSWWFIAGQFLLAVNIFCAASIRYPWKKHQTGFVITHIGLLTLLAGSAISYQGNVNSQMLVYEGETSRHATDRDVTFVTLENIPDRAEPVRFEFKSGPFNWGDQPLRDTMVKLFDRNAVTRGWLNLLGVREGAGESKPDPVTVFEDDQTRVEITDFYARAEAPAIPYASLTFFNPMVPDTTMDLKIQHTQYQFGNGDPVGFGRTQFGQLGELYLWKAETSAEWEAFQETIPSQSVEGDGAIVVRVGEETQTFKITDLQGEETENGYRAVELADGWTLRLIEADQNFRPVVDQELMAELPWLNIRRGQRISLGPKVELELQRGDADPIRQRLYAKIPYIVDNVTDDVRVEFYHPTNRGRICLVVGPEGELAYRVWQKGQKRVVNSGSFELAVNRDDGTLRSREIVPTWSTGGQDENGVNRAWQMTLKTYIPSAPESELMVSEDVQEKPGFDQGEQFIDFWTTRRELRPIPLPFDKENAGFSRMIKLRFSQRESGDFEPYEERWIRVKPPQYAMVAETDNAFVENIDVPGADQPLLVQYHMLESDVGFLVKLVKFKVKYDPGTKMAREYESYIAQIDVRDEPEIEALNEKVDRAADPDARQQAREERQATLRSLSQEKLKLIDKLDYEGIQAAAEKEPWLEANKVYMNNPLDYPDLNGKTLRFFQESFQEPQGNTPPATIFRVNHDQGRWVKYLGSALISFGIFMMFYMRAYFFTGKKRTQNRTATDATGSTATADRGSSKKAASKNAPASVG